MSATADRRARLASNDEREGGGFPLPSLIEAAVETIMDAGVEGVSLGAVTDAVTAQLRTDKRRIHHIWKQDSIEASFRALTEDLVTELVAGEFVVSGDRLHITEDVLRKVRAAGDDGYRVTLNLKPHGRHHRLVHEASVRARLREQEAYEDGRRQALNYAATARIGSEKSRKRIEEIADSMRATGYDRTKPVILDPEGNVVAGHHRVAAAALAGVDVVPMHTTSLEEALLAAWRDNDGRRWAPNELEGFAVRLHAKGKTDQEIADALHVSRPTVGRLQANAAKENGKPARSPGRPAWRDDPAVVEFVALHHDAGETNAAIAELSGTPGSGWPYPEKTIGKTAVREIVNTLDRGASTKMEVGNAHLSISDPAPENKAPEPSDPAPTSAPGTEVVTALTGALENLREMSALDADAYDDIKRLLDDIDTEVEAKHGP